VPVACSFAQERIWRSSRTAEGSAGYTMASQMRIRGPLEVEAFHVAIQHAVARHDVLHTTFVEREGRPLQVVGAPPEIEMPVIELSGSRDPDGEIEVILHRHALEPRWHAARAQRHCPRSGRCSSSRAGGTSQVRRHRNRPPDLHHSGNAVGIQLRRPSPRETERWGATFDARIHDSVAVRGFIGRCAALVRRVVAKPNRRLRRLRP